MYVRKIYMSPTLLPVKFGLANVLICTIDHSSNGFKCNKSLVALNELVKATNTVYRTIYIYHKKQIAS